VNEIVIIIVISITLSISGACNYQKAVYQGLERVKRDSWTTTV